MNIPRRKTMSTIHLRYLTRIRSLFTNANAMKKDDPYAILGIHWGATKTEIKEAFREKARQLHPDVNQKDSAEEALNKFKVVQKAYSTLMNAKGVPNQDIEEWSFAVWRNCDLIAQERDDVAGVMRKRPIKPAEAVKPGTKWGVASLGHPDGGGNQPRRAEYLHDGKPVGPRSSTVGNGQNKWVEPKEYIPWKR